MVKPSASPAARNADDRLAQLGLERMAEAQEIIGAFESGLTALGYAESKNIRVLYRFADGNADRLSTLTVELVSLGATIIVTAGTTSIRATHDTAPSVPIVAWAGANPLLMGWAQTLGKTRRDHRRFPSRVRRQIVPIA